MFPMKYVRAMYLGHITDPNEVPFSAADQEAGCSTLLVDCAQVWEQELSASSSLL